MLTEFVVEKNGHPFIFYYHFKPGGFGEFPEYTIHVWDRPDPNEEERGRFFELRAVGCDYGVRIDFFDNFDYAQFKGKDLPDAVILLVPDLVKDRVRSSMKYNPHDSRERRNDLSEKVWKRMERKGLVRHIQGEGAGQDYYELIEKKKPNDDALVLYGEQAHAADPLSPLEIPRA